MKMVTEGWSTNMRHVSRTHRVDLGWVHDGINLDKAVPNQYVNTNEQIADVLTKGSFSQEGWKQLTLADILWYFRLLATACPSDQEKFLLNKCRHSRSRYMVCVQKEWMVWQLPSTTSTRCRC